MANGTDWLAEEFKKWQTTLQDKAEIVYDNYPYLVVVEWIDNQERRQSRAWAWPGVYVVALDEATGEIFEVHQGRDGIQTQEIPGGGVDPGMNPEEAGLQELLEEAGVIPSVDAEIILVCPEGGHMPVDGLIYSPQAILFVSSAKKVQEVVDVDIKRVETISLEGFTKRRREGWSSKYRDPVIALGVLDVEDYVKRLRM